MSSIELKVAPDGTLSGIWSDTFKPLKASASSIKIRRASHVEPTDDGCWTADLAPSNGPLLGPFETRAEALAAEVKWLKSHSY